MTKKLITKQEGSLIIKMIKQGYTCYEVGKIVNRHATTIQKWYKKRQAETYFNVNERENWAI